jgi:SRSO17 transposase
MILSSTTWRSIMTRDEIAALGGALSAFLDGFAGCFERRAMLEHFRTYCRGLLSDLPRKSVEPIALAADTAVRTLQFFLARGQWDHQRLRDRLQRRVADRHMPPPGEGRSEGELGLVGIIDETGHLKKGDKTPGVQRQYCGTAGKVDNCVISVHLACARGGFQCLLDQDLYLPQSWSDDRDRCREADIPHEVVYRPKWRIALEQVERAMGNGVRFDWLTFDEEYGKVPEFLFELDRLGQTYIGEVPPQALFYGRAPKYQSLRKEYQASEARHLVRHGHLFIYTPWVEVKIRRQTLASQVWRVKAARVHRVIGKGPQRRATQREYWLIHACQPDSGEHKYFLCNAPESTPLATLLAAAFQRARVEHCFRIAKSELGMSHFEGRSYLALMRHLTLVQLLLLFLAEHVAGLGGGKGAGDDRAGGEGAQRDLPALAAAPTPAGA